MCPAVLCPAVLCVSRVCPAVCLKVLSGAAMKHHVQGDSWHTDGLRQGKKHSFSLLVGIDLSDTIVPNNGNLCVWPKSHLHIHHWMRHPDGMIRRIPPTNTTTSAYTDAGAGNGAGNGAIDTRAAGDRSQEQPFASCVGYSEAKRERGKGRALEGYRDSDGSLPDLGLPVQVSHWPHLKHCSQY